ncbi:MAG TPA: peptidyl-prolyl cis-trans isomerase, partial [Phaeodactylibacter sp.]|nr:peptidyl-prolyl cis-trans isomerase [Phaeodactylibacter sp.]
MFFISAFQNEASQTIKFYKKKNTMKKQLLFLVVLISSIFAYQNLQAQDADPVLFSVENNPVHLSEFKYIYTKTNGGKADFSKKSLEEYLDLYVKFKLKVQRAKDMKLDTIPSLQQELEGYRQQLANSYLVDKQVTERLVKEAYERTKKDIDVSHIMVSIKPNATPKDTLAAFEKIKNIKANLDSGIEFAKVAKGGSDDKSAKSNGGHIGFITALLPNGFYDFETAAYNLKKGETTIVRSAAGYHILKVNGSRPARGQIEAAHILIRKNKKDNGAAAKVTIDSIYQVLQNGGDFEALARKYSQDNLSASKGGNIGFFGINKYERSFENAAFAIPKDGEYSKPVQTQVGWHIIKRLRKKPIESYEIAKRKLQPQIQKDSRYQIAKDAMLQRIKKEGKFRENKRAFTKFTGTLGDDFKTHKWKPSDQPARDVLFTLAGNVKYTVADFEAFAKKNSRDRLRMGRSKTAKQIADFLYGKFVSENLMKYEERQLDKKYPEFKALMREYEEGILLFEATKILVWDKASQDTVGLEKYFAAHKDNRKYMWNERAEVSFYSLKKQAAKRIKKVRKCAKKRSPEKTLAKVNKKEKILTHRTEIIEKGKNKVVVALPWKKGSISPTEINKRDQSLNFLK